MHLIVPGTIKFNNYKNEKHVFHKESQFSFICFQKPKIGYRHPKNTPNNLITGWVSLRLGTA